MLGMYAVMSCMLLFGKIIFLKGSNQLHSHGKNARKQHIRVSGSMTLNLEKPDENDNCFIGPTTRHQWCQQWIRKPTSTRAKFSLAKDSAQVDFMQHLQLFALYRENVL